MTRLGKLIKESTLGPGNEATENLDASVQYLKVVRLLCPARDELHLGYYLHSKRGGGGDFLLEGEIFLGNSLLANSVT